MEGTRTATRSRDRAARSRQARARDREDRYRGLVSGRLAFVTTTVASQTAAGSSGDYERYERALPGVEAPFAIVDLDAMWRNGNDMLHRTAGKPIRVASKSVRCRPLLERILQRDPGFRGLLGYTLPEALWLAEHGFDDLVVAYPTADRTAIAELARVTDRSEQAPTLMVDCAEHLEYIEAARRQGAGPVSGGTPHAPIRVCIELDVGYWTARGRLKIGPKRSPIRTPEQAVALAREIESRPGVRLVGLMAYEGHIAGVGDRPPGKRLQGAAIRALQRRSAAEIRERRAAVVAAVSRIAELEFVNGGGTGSLEATASEPAVTEVAAGSGFYAPTLFDAYSAFKLRPAAMFALPVVRKPAPSVATALGGGYLASGVGDASRLPTPYLPAGLRLDRFEGAGEVQTPLLGAPARELRVGDRVYFRHAKAGELCERFEVLHLVEGDRVVDEVPTYRGEGRCFL
jgi:D-serine deaminase-like pyridoxal phosphate-dependent protein